MSIKTSNNKLKLSLISFALVVSIGIMIAKFYAWWTTKSNAIFSDALESIVNVTAGSVALYSIWLSSKPKDENHPYGHGKMEDVSAGFEGALITIAGLIAIGKAIYGFSEPNQVQRLEVGLWVVGITGALNFLVGFFIHLQGKSQGSNALMADGNHLKSDAYTSAGLLIGLLVVFYTKIWWLDHVVAIIFGAFIVYLGARTVRKAVGVMTDEADQQLIRDVVRVLQENRKPIWMDIHKMRIQKFGQAYHIDCHLTLPWYLIVKDAHKEVDAIEALINTHFPKNDIELNIHIDPCQPSACGICNLPYCGSRQHEFDYQVEWTFENLTKNKAHEHKAP